MRNIIDKIFYTIRDMTAIEWLIVAAIIAILVAMIIG